MKKKIKIFSTIASLCLAVALMAFGVYAATQVSIVATSTINFSTSEITGYWSVCAAATTNATVTADDADNQYLGTSVVKVTDSEATGNENKTDIAVALPSFDITDTSASGVATITYKVAFTATGEKMADLTVTAAATGDNVAAIAIDKASQTDTTETKEVPVEFTIVVTYTNADIADRSVSASSIITITASAVPAK